MTKLPFHEFEYTFTSRKVSENGWKLTNLSRDNFGRLPRTLQLFSSGLNISEINLYWDVCIMRFAELLGFWSKVTMGFLIVKTQCNTMYSSNRFTIWQVGTGLKGFYLHWFSIMIWVAEFHAAWILKLEVPFTRKLHESTESSSNCCSSLINSKIWKLDSRLVCDLCWIVSQRAPIFYVIKRDVVLLQKFTPSMVYLEHRSS